MCTPCMLAARRRLARWGAALHSPRWHCALCARTGCATNFVPCTGPEPWGGCALWLSVGTHQHRALQWGQRCWVFCSELHRWCPAPSAPCESVSVLPWWRCMRGDMRVCMELSTGGELELRFSLVVPKRSGEE